jgi:hypothetical protein
MKLSGEDLQTLRRAAVVAEAQQELVDTEKRRAEGRPAGTRAAGPVFAAIAAVTVIVMYLSVLAVTTDRDTAGPPIFLSGDFEQPPPRG